jgi:hypothetical protein
LDLSRRKIDVCLLSAGGEIVEEFRVAAEVVPFAVELRGGDPVVSERRRA